MSQPNRAETMATKLAAYAGRAAVAHDELLRAYELAVARRISFLRDVFHPDLLHPARTALILLEDAGVRDGEILTAAALTETEFGALRVPQSTIRELFSARVADLEASVPQPEEAGDMLLERLLEIPRAVALIAVAERLDHARHLHFRDSALWAEFHAQVCAVYQPFALRVSEPLAQRFSRWSGAFQRRFLLSA